MNDDRAPGGDHRLARGGRWLVPLLLGALTVWAMLAWRDPRLEAAWASLYLLCGH